MDELVLEIRALRGAIEALVTVLSPDEGEPDPVSGLAEQIERLANAVESQTSAVNGVENRVSDLRETVRGHLQEPA